MNRPSHFKIVKALLAASLICLLCGPSRADDKRESLPVVKKPISAKSETETKPVKPERPKAAEVRELIQDFKAQREDFIKEKKAEAQQQLKTSATDTRTVVRDTAAAAASEAKAQQQEAKQQAIDARDRLKEHAKKIVEEQKSAARGKVRE